MTRAREMPAHPLQHDPQRFVFCLLPEFSMLSLCSALEPLRIANRIAGRRLYDWVFCGDAAADIASSIGVTVPVGSGFPEVRSDDVVLVCGGMNVESAASAQVMNWLRKTARKGAAMGGLCTGTFVLAHAGLLQNRRATIHWENQHSLTELFPDVHLTHTPTEIDGNRYSTAGGVSSIDLMLALIEVRHGAALAHEVSEQLLYKTLQAVQSSATITTDGRKRLLHPKLQPVVRAMEDNLEVPLTISELAALVHVS
ncbi:DJ-1/PfpI family protein, partial [Cognatishimia sp. SS12]|uniref:GlxA family transcriptional regulator n=1 Tax=Cognatishimia sp. SS12 TaxID=2979465 RepID=UPI00232B8E4B